MRAELTAPAFRALISEFERRVSRPLFPPTSSATTTARVAASAWAITWDAKLLTALQLTVRGLPFIYYGEELGMRSVDLDARRAIDPVAHIYRFVPTALSRWLRKRGVLINRDEARTPMQWSDAEHAGFCPKDAKPWLPVDPSTESHRRRRAGDPSRCGTAIAASSSCAGKSRAEQWDALLHSGLAAADRPGLPPHLRR